MRYAIALIILSALFLQISCKSNEVIQDDRRDVTPRTHETVDNDKISAEITEPAPEEEKLPGIVNNISPKEDLADQKSESIAQAPVRKEPETPEQTAVEVEPQRPSDEKGIVSYVEGSVRKKAVGEDDFRTNVALKTPVRSREAYRTMVRSRAELELSEMDILRLAPRTTVDLVALYEETRTGTQKTDIVLEEGDLWAQVNSAGDNSEFMMNTDIAAAAITGTNFRLSKNGEQTEMRVYHGEVKISNARDRMDKIEPSSVTDFKKPGQIMGPRQVSGPRQVTMDEWVYIVRNMQKITFDNTGKVVSAGEFKATDPEEKTDWVEWNRRMDRQRGLR